MNRYTGLAVWINVLRVSFQSLKVKLNAVDWLVLKVHISCLPLDWVSHGLVLGSVLQYLKKTSTIII